jgi:hypothetical protein
VPAQCAHGHGRRTLGHALCARTRPHPGARAHDDRARARVFVPICFFSWQALSAHTRPHARADARPRTMPGRQWPRAPLRDHDGRTTGTRPAHGKRARVAPARVARGHVTRARAHALTARTRATWGALRDHDGRPASAPPVCPQWRPWGALAERIATCHARTRTHAPGARTRAREAHKTTRKWLVLRHFVTVKPTCGNCDLRHNSNVCLHAAAPLA